LDALKDANTSIAEAEDLIAEQVRLAENIDGLSKRAEAMAKGSTHGDTDFAKLLEDDGTANGDRQKLVQHMAHVRGEITSAYIELKAVFANAPELPYPPLDQIFTPVPAPDPLVQSVQERLNVYKTCAMHYCSSRASSRTI
jgi:hypothetical protein